MKRRWIAIILVFAAVGTLGCEQTPLSESKAKAYETWAASRVKILSNLTSDLYRSGQLERARKKAREALEIEPENPPLRILLAKIHIEEGHYLPAIQELDRLIPQEDFASEAYYYKGVALEKMAHRDQALESYLKSVELEKNPHNFAPIQAAAEMMTLTGQIDRAREFLYPKLSPRISEPGAFELAGRLAMMKKDYGRAVNFFQSAWDLNRKSKVYPEMLAAAQFAVGQATEAAETIQRILKDQKSAPPVRVYLMLGDCMMDIGNTRRAQEAYRAACQIAPENSNEWSALAKSHLERDDLPGAIHTANEARKIDPGNLDAAMILGYALLKDEKPAQAIKILQEAHEKNASDPMLACLLGRAYQDDGKSESARRCFALALKLQPDNIVAQKLLASQQ